MDNTISSNLEKILKRIENACKIAHRNTEDVKLLLATKTVSANNIKIALKNNQTLIGENKIKEIKEKYNDLKNTKHQKHLKYIFEVKQDKLNSFFLNLNWLFFQLNIL